MKRMWFAQSKQFDSSIILKEFLSTYEKKFAASIFVRKKLGSTCIIHLAFFIWGSGLCNFSHHLPVHFCFNDNSYKNSQTFQGHFQDLFICCHRTASIYETSVANSKYIFNR